MKGFYRAASAAVLACTPAVLSAQSSPISVTTVQANPANTLVVQRPAEVVSGSALPSNSEVWLSMDHELNSKKTKVGDKFDMTVARDVMLGQYVVIPRGTPAHGQISYRTGKGAFGKSAKMEFDLVDVVLPSRTVPVAGHYRIEGQGNTGAAVGAVVAAGVFGAFVTGHSASATQGSEWKAATKEPLIVSFAPEAVARREAAVEPVAQVQAPPASAAPATVVKSN